MPRSGESRTYAHENRVVTQFEFPQGVVSGSWLRCFSPSGGTGLSSIEMAARQGEFGYCPPLDSTLFSQANMKQYIVGLASIIYCMLDLYILSERYCG